MFWRLMCQYVESDAWESGEPRSFPLRNVGIIIKKKWKKNAHILSMHEGTSGTQSFQCDECSLSYTEAKNLKAHKKLEHSSNAITFSQSSLWKNIQPEE